MNESTEKAAPGIVGRVVPGHMRGTREHQLLEQLVDREGYSLDDIAVILDRILEWIEGDDG